MIYAITGPAKSLEPYEAAVVCGQLSAKFWNAKGFSFGGARGVDELALWFCYLTHPEIPRTIYAPATLPWQQDSVPPETTIVLVGGNYMDRNTALVAAPTDVLLAFPFTAAEERRSGTWSTVRRAAKRGIPTYVTPISQL